MSNNACSISTKAFWVVCFHRKMFSCPRWLVPTSLLHRVWQIACKHLLLWAFEMSHFWMPLSWRWTRTSHHKDSFSFFWHRNLMTWIGSGLIIYRIALVTGDFGHVCFRHEIPQAIADRNRGCALAMVIAGLAGLANTAWAFATLVERNVRCSNSSEGCKKRADTQKVKMQCMEVDEVKKLRTNSNAPWMLQSDMMRWLSTVWKRLFLNAILQFLWTGVSNPSKRCDFSTRVGVESLALG